MNDTTKPGRGSDQFPLRLPDGKRASIKRAAEANGRSMNAELLHRLQQWESLNFEHEILNAIHESRSQEIKEQKAQLAGLTTDNLNESLAFGLPKKLYERVKRAAGSNGRDVAQEVIAALNRAFPPPAPFSMDWFCEEWIPRIVAAQGDERDELLDAANEVLEENGDLYEVWETYAGKGDSPGQVVIGRKDDFGSRSVASRNKK
tara:strand:+ start:498 stop:1109 length:612 start_codon:yes stop_codon:yes gene_type:complete